MMVVVVVVMVEDEEEVEGTVFALFVSIPVLSLWFSRLLVGDEDLCRLFPPAAAAAAVAAAAAAEQAAEGASLLLLFVDMNKGNF